MRKIFTTAFMLIAAMTASAQDNNDDILVTLDFNQNPWNYSVRQSTDKDAWGGTQVCPKGTKDYFNLDGSLLTDKDFSWPMPDGSGSTDKIKVTLYAVDLDEFNAVSVYGNYPLNDAEAAGCCVEAGYRNILFTRPGTTMRFESPKGFKFKKLVFNCYSMNNILTGDGAYDEEYEYTYNGNTFKTKRKYWTPESPKFYEGETAGTPFKYGMWDGDATNVLFNYIYFGAYFVTIDMTLTPDGSSGISNLQTTKKESNTMTTLDGRTVNKSEGLRKGVYIVDGKKVVVK